MPEERSDGGLARADRSHGSLSRALDRHGVESSYDTFVVGVDGEGQETVVEGSKNREELGSSSELRVGLGLRASRTADRSSYLPGVVVCKDVCKEFSSEYM